MNLLGKRLRLIYQFNIGFPGCFLSVGVCIFQIRHGAKVMEPHFITVCRLCSQPFPIRTLSGEAAAAALMLMLMPLTRIYCEEEKEKKKHNFYFFLTGKNNSCL